MKQIIRIAKTELATLFYSPIAWLILVVFSVQVGLDFIKIFNEILRVIALGNTITFSITAGFLLGSNGLYEVIQDTLFLYIPLLTMNLLSREYSSGSIKLLYSSPITSTQIVIGKYTSMLVFAFILTFILALPLLAIAIFVPSPDIILGLSGLLGLFLLVSTYCAIGLFMSSLTSYQVVSAVATLSALAFLSKVGSMGQEYEFIRELTYWLSINGRASEMVGGLICSEDIIYFILVIGLFISFTILKIYNEKTRYSWILKAGQYLGIIATVMILGYFSSRPSLMGFYDSTRVNQRTLAQNSQEIMNQLDGGLKITTYLNIFDNDYDTGAPENIKTDMARFKLYTRFKPEIEMEYEYYYSRPTDTSFLNKYPGKTVDEIAVEIAKKKGLNPRKLKAIEDMPKDIDFAGEGYRFFRVIERESGEKSIIRIFDDMFRHPSETEVTAALKKLIVDPIKVGFIVDNAVRDVKTGGDRDFSLFATKRNFRNSMINQGFDLVPLSLDTLKSIPSNIKILFIADIKESYNKEQIEIIDDFIEKGGDFMLMTDVGKQKEMNPLLERFGVKAGDGILVQPTELYSADLIRTVGVKKGADTVKGTYSRLVKYGEYQTITMPGAVPLRILDTTKFCINPLLATNPEEVWVEYQTTDFINEKLSLDPKKGEQKNAYITAVSLTRKVGEKEQRGLIFGDADCISNYELMQSGRSGFYQNNFSSITTNFRWLCHGAFPVYPVREKNSDTELNVGPSEFPYFKYVFIWLIPILIGLIGYFTFKKRNNY